MQQSLKKYLKRYLIVVEEETLEMNRNYNMFQRRMNRYGSKFVQHLQSYLLRPSFNGAFVLELHSSNYTIIQHR
jgi:hypothetical protein